MTSGKVVESIRREDVEGLLLQACPSFAASPGRLEYHEDYDGEEEPLCYLLASALVRHLTELNGAGRRSEFPAVFDVIEKLHLRGDEYVCDLATVGFLEDLQNTNLHPTTSKPNDFVPYLGPVSLWWWKEVELFWEGKVNPIGSSGRVHPPDMGLSARALSTPERGPS